MAEDTSSLLRLMSWLSPAFPVGAFAYSHGLESAIHDGFIRDRATLSDWLSDLVQHGSGWNDTVLLAAAWRDATAGGDGADIAGLAEAMAGSRERHMETTLQGDAFREAVSAWASDNCINSRSTLPPSVLPDISPTRGEIGQSPTSKPLISLLVGEMSGRTEGGNVERHSFPAELTNMPYPVAVGITAAQHGLVLEATLAAYLHAFSSNLIQAAVRLVPFGQRDGVATLAALEPIVLETAKRSAGSSLDDLGSATFMSEVMSMKHEVQYSRVFRS